jgi:hypothetical protein
MARFKRSKDRPYPISVRDFYNKRNRILVLRETGGLGDILMHRMMFEDFKLLAPDLNVCFACPEKYHEAVEDHPYIDEILDSKKIDPRDFVMSYTTTSACTRHEMMMAPLSKKNRADIWANHCGVELTRHNMHINLESRYAEAARERLGAQNGPKIALCPISAMIVKNLTTEQQNGLIARLRLLGCYTYILHNKPLPEVDAPVWNGLSIREWMGAIDAADYVISVDTAGFHYAGGTGKPLTGIFTFADGKVYGRHYDFVLVQKHWDNGDWDCGPCYSWPNCPKVKTVPKPCLTELTIDIMMDGVQQMMEKWPFGKKTHREPTK